MNKRLFLIAALFNALMAAALCTAQPTLSRSQIPSRLIPEMKEQLNHLYDTDAGVRARAAAYFGDLGERGEAAIPFLISMLADDIKIDPINEGRYLISMFDYEVTLKTSPALQAARSLSNLGDVAVKPLIDALKHDSRQVRLKAVKILGMLESVEAVRPLMEAARAQEWQIREAAADALGDLESASALPVLRKLLDDPQWQVRIEAIN